jgi:phenylpropionate dioxygenase-like ring-hydroxylating dioxygenase large terminal subunit
LEREVEAEIHRVFGAPRERELRAPSGLGDLLRPCDYTDPKRLEAELSGVFRRAWIPAASVEQLAAPGDAVTFELAGEPVVLVRDEAGAVRALRNVCLHRGAQIVRDPAARLRSLRCAYHGLEFGFDGERIRCPAPLEFASAPSADSSRARLPAFRCERFGGWWWVNLAAGAPSLHEALGAELVDELSNYPLDDLTLVAARELDAAFDWKVGVEAFLEPLHVPSIHPRSAHPLVDYRGMAVRELGDHSRMALPFRVPGAYAPDGPLGEAALRAGVPNFARLNAVQSKAHLVYLLFPSFVLMLFPNHLLALRFLPRGVGRCALRWELRALPAASETARAWLASLVPGYERLVDEDLENLPWIQRGLASPSLERLALSEFEVRIAQFRRALERWLV